MTSWLRRGFWLLALLIGLPLLLGLIWWLLNLGDVEPQLWPQALELPRNNVPAADNLLTLLNAAPAIADGRLSLDACDGDNCLQRWREQLPTLAAKRAANPGFGEVCEGLATRVELRFEDPVPETLRIDWALPSLMPLTSCHSWLLSRALEASEAGDDQALLHWLRQADRLDHAAIAGSRSMVAQGVSAGLWGRKLKLLVALAQNHPVLSQDLARFARFDEQAWLARQLDAVRVEASYQRAAIEATRTTHCDDDRLAMGGLGRWHCRLMASSGQPAYLSRLFGDRWLRVQLHLQQTRTLPGSLATLRDLLVDAGSVSLWQRVRHTVPHWLDDVARPTYVVHLQRNVDLQLAAEATRLWLTLPQADWSTRASPELRQRLRPRVDGTAGWQLTPHRDDAGERLPLRWPTLS
ncbi:MAG: hypothetical protein ACK4F7_08640 [Inhella sp.]